MSPPSLPSSNPSGESLRDVSKEASQYPPQIILSLDRSDGMDESDGFSNTVLR